MALITTVPDPQSLADTVAERLTSRVLRASAAGEPVMVCLTGGQTARPIYQRWSDPAGPWRRQIEWTRLHFFWSDERHVPPEHPDSNFGMATRALLERLPIDPSHVHRIHGELPDPAEAARQYELELRRTCSRAARGTLSFDVSLLTIGEDGHIASIFPESPLLEAQDPVAAVWVPHLQAWRVTLTPPVLLGATTTIVIASGRRKAAAVHAALEGPPNIRCCPAQLLRHAGDRVEWIVDAEAAVKRKLET